MGHVGWGWVECEFIFSNSQPFTNDSNSRNNNSYGFENSQMDMAVCV